MKTDVDNDECQDIDEEIIAQIADAILNNSPLPKTLPIKHVETCSACKAKLLDYIELIEITCT